MKYYLGSIVSPYFIDFYHAYSHFHISNWWILQSWKSKQQSWYSCYYPWASKLTECLFGRKPWGQQRSSLLGNAESSNIPDGTMSTPCGGIDTSMAPVLPLLYMHSLCDVTLQCLPTVGVLACPHFSTGPLFWLV